MPFKKTQVFQDSLEKRQDLLQRTLQVAAEYHHTYLYFCTSENDIRPSPRRRIILLIMCEGAGKMRAVFLRRKGVQITSPKRPVHTMASQGGGGNGKATPNGGISHRPAEKGTRPRPTWAMHDNWKRKYLKVCKQGLEMVITKKALWLKRTAMRLGLL